MCFLVIRTGITLLHRGSHWVSPTPPPHKKTIATMKKNNCKRPVDNGKREKAGKRSVGAALQVSPKWSQETMTCHSSNCFSIVYGQGNAPLVTSLPTGCYMRREKASSLPLPTILCTLLFLRHGQPPYDTKTPLRRRLRVAIMMVMKTMTVG